MFACPECLSFLETANNALNCQRCHKSFQLSDKGKLTFTKLTNSSINDQLDRIKNRLKKFNRFYRFLISLVSPVYPTRDLRKFLNTKDLDSNVVINLGSGSSNIDSRIVNFDIFEYDYVDVLCSIDSLPLVDNSVDSIINLAVLEHVPNPTKVVEEFHRVLKHGGEAFCFVPFIQGFHASPWDFQRYTSSGLRELFKEFEILKLKPVGPTSGLLWIFQEWFAIVFSFGNKRLHLILWLLALLTTWPLKFLDFFLQRNKMSENIASGFVVILRKIEKS